MRSCIALLLAASLASVASAQGGSYGSVTPSPMARAYANGLYLPGNGSLAAGAGLDRPPRRVDAVPAPPAENPLASRQQPVVTCNATSCVGVDGTQYARGAGNVVFGSNGRVCQLTAPGAPLVCG